MLAFVPRFSGSILPESIVAVAQGRLIAIDWHQVTDVCRYSGRRHVQATDNGQIPADVATFYNKVNRRLCAGDCQIVLSHIERSADNLQRVLRGVRQSRLPVSYVFVTEKHSGLVEKLRWHRTCCTVWISRAGLVCLTTTWRWLRSSHQEAEFEGSGPIALRTRIFARLPGTCCSTSLTSNVASRAGRVFFTYRDCRLASIAPPTSLHLDSFPAWLHPISSLATFCATGFVHGFLTIRICITASVEFLT